jgi:hypothetical protein
VHASGELAVVQPGRRHPIEAAVMDAVGTHGHRSVDTVRWRLADDERLRDLGRSLASAGLLRRRLRLRLGRRNPDRSEWSPTAAGHAALRRATGRPPADPALDGGSALPVALHGRHAMADADLRAAIFERPLPPVAPGGFGRRLRQAEDRNPFSARHRAHGVMGGAATFGFLEGGAGDGGGS